MRSLLPLLVLGLVAHTARADDTEEAVCGNDVLEGDEQCDDGNTRDHDGCDASCRPEPLWGCGNVILTEAVLCDDDGEACMYACQIDTY